MKKPYIFIFLAFVVAAIAALALSNKSAPEKITPSSPLSELTKQDKIILAEPISDALSRVVKKPFGIYVTPANSPVSPEKFTGYHTGVDFETSSYEKDADVAISAICDGKLLLAKFGRGYGGMAVESCDLEGSPITVVYGHIRLSSVSVKVGETMLRGVPFAVLGTGYSSETDGERKHLHLGIHIGSTIDTRGYVANESLLSDWVNALNYLK
jgi:hypothetical protein